MSTYNILILGSGAREHTLAWKIKQSPKVNSLYVAPGNAGTASIATNLPINISDFEQVKQSIVEHSINFVVVGPEEPIVKGIVDYLLAQPETKDCYIIAPTSEGAKLEGSKSWAKQFMLKYNIPTARYHIVTQQTLNEGKNFLKTFTPPYVLKADGLAAGKGVMILHDYHEACLELEAMLNGKFGKASETVVIEQFLKGIECSYFILTDGDKYVILPEAKDYKRIGEGDTGLNTGGMGAISPVPFITRDLRKKINELIVHRTVYGLLHEKINYKGFLFIGLLISDNMPYVIEYNVRLGDPETEAILPRIKTDIIDLFEQLFDGTLNQCNLEIDENYSVCVVAASQGYPLAFEKGKIIEGLENVPSTVFHAGTTINNNTILTNGGRVLVVSDKAPDLKEAKQKVYQSLEKIHFENIYYRRDIGFEF